LSSATDDIVAYLVQARAENPALRISDLVVLVRERFGLRVHPRSIERRLARAGQTPKKKPQT
jgi:dienelactone hydrolase